MPQLRQTSLVDPTGQPKLPDDILDGDKKCESCGQPGSPVHCSGCSALDVGSFCIRYCSAHCQMAHWEKHKEKCHAYRRLLRALRVVVPIWDHFLRLTRTTNVKFAGFDGNVIHLKPSKTTEGVDPRAWTGESLFHPFPDDNVSGTLCEKVELALLHDCRCDDIIAVCFSLINTFLQRM